MSAPEWFIDNVPLDPDRLESIRARAVQGYAPTMRDTLNLVAEVERLQDLVYMLNPARMVLDRCAELMPGCREEAAAMAQRIVDLIGHPVTDEPPHALVELERLRAESVPRSSLVAQPRYHHDECMGAEFGCYCMPVYVIREDTDA